MQNNLDEKINYIRFYNKYFKEMKPVGKNKILVRCPFHNDHKASMWFNTGNGCWKCEACGESGNAQTFIEKFEGIGSAEAYKMLLKEAGEYKGSVKRKSIKYTISDYCIEKNLPVEYIKSLGIKNGRTGIIIPYMDEMGQVVANRQRYHPESSVRFTWDKGSRVHLYGLWKISKIREKGYVILVEGESDTQTLWLHQEPALGVPGASAFSQDWVPALEGLRIFIHQEPDIGGETFIRKVCVALASKNPSCEVYRIQVQGVKDPSELHIRYPESFNDRWKKIINNAEPIDLKEFKAQSEELIPGAPVQLRQPHGWRIDERGIYREDDKTGALSCICKTPVLLFRRMKSLDTGEEKMEITFFRDNKWQSAVMSRSILFQSRTIIQLADLGITVTSENAKIMVKYLGALEAENIDVLQVKSTVSQMGWYGKSFLPGHGGDITIDTDRNSTRWADAYRSEGTLEDWIENMKPFREKSIFRFILASSFTAPLLQPLNHRIFFVHNWGDSRGGKTAALKAALSVWGNPEELMISFNATRVGFERIAGFFNDLPLGIDERQVAGNKQEFIDQLVYMLSTGSSRIRGTKTGGIQDLRSWSTVVLTTGEEPLTTMSSQTGVATRVIEISGSPFENECAARKMHELSVENYGTAGQAFIEEFISNTDTNYDELRRRHKDISDKLQDLYPEKLGSHISAVAAVVLADELISKWLFSEDGKESYAMGIDILSMLEDTEETDVVDKAFEFIQGWLLSNTREFGSEAKGPQYGMIKNDIYYVFPQILEKALKDAGFSYKKILKGFGDRGYIGLSYIKDKRTFTVTKRFHGKVTRFVEIDLSDLEKEEETPPF